MNFVGVFGSVCDGAWRLKRKWRLGCNTIAKFDVLRNEVLHTGRALPVRPIFGTLAGQMPAGVATTAKKHGLVRAYIGFVRRKGGFEGWAKCTGHCCVWYLAPSGTRGFNFFGSYVCVSLRFQEALPV